LGVCPEEGEGALKKNLPKVVGKTEVGGKETWQPGNLNPINRPWGG